MYRNSPPNQFSQQITSRIDIDFALRAAGLGVWEYDPVSGRVQWDDRCAELFAIPNDPHLRYDDTLSHIHPDDVNAVKQAIELALNPASGGDYLMTYRVTGQAGQPRWIRSTGRCEFNAAGQAIRFSGVAQDVTTTVQHQQQLEASEERFRNLIEQGPVAMAIFRGPDHIIELANDAHLKLWGRTAEQVLGIPLFEAMPELKGQGYEELLTNVLTTGNPFYAHELSARLIRDGQQEQVYFNFVYQAERDAQGLITGVMVVANDITDQVMARQRAEDEELVRRSLIEEATVAAALYTGRDNRIAYVNDIMLGYWGRDRTVIGQTFRDALPELEAQGFPDLMDRVLKTGVAYQSPNAEAHLMVDGSLKQGFYNFTYKPLFDSAGKPWGVLHMALDVTEQVLAQQKVEESEARFRDLAESSGMLIALGDETGSTTYFNQAWLDYTGRPINELLRHGWMDLIHPDDLAQLVSNHQRSIDLRQAHGTEFRMRDRTNTYHWLYLQDTPQFTTDGAYSGSIGTTIDIHERKVAGQKLTESEATLQHAIELAELGTWSVDYTTNQITVSPRTANWFGMDSLHDDAEKFIAAVGEEDAGRVRDHLMELLNSEEGGIYNLIHPVINIKTGQKRLIQALGKTTHDIDGKVLRIDGTAQDITLQQELQLALANEVQERTKELALANQELLARNNELLETNGLLLRSNENLQKFAYVASHDLQEPLRKIRQFGDLLKQGYGDADSEVTDYLNRMQSAATRMSTLIKDLLDYSRISTRRERTQLVPLTTVLDSVLSTLELTIAETSATIHVAPLPTIPGDPTQLSQLFQNLLSNALKFRRPDVEPVVTIAMQSVPMDQLPPAVKPAQLTSLYHRIDVTDNGIGFDEKYVDRIFQVFQRLHSKTNIAGTGIGLAICEKVVTNHGGAISASSQPGEGATFSIYLPADDLIDAGAGI